MSKHRATRRTVRTRGPVGVLVLALAVVVAVTGVVVGVVPQLTADRAAADGNAALTAPTTPSSLETATFEQVEAPAPDPDLVALAAEVDRATQDADPAPPAESGEGRRIVFSQSDQRVWLVEDGEEVDRTYLVSGSRFDNLDPGSYTVQSRTRHATAFDYSGTMEYFVRFATGYSEPIGFHSVPRYNNGELEQTKAQLGTPLSAGCVRQWEPDAVALWDFAPVGTPVVVTP